MTDQEHLAPAWGEPTAVSRCWMCGIRLSTGSMVVDGGSACADVRWYCRDTRGCTERWTSRPARPADIGQGSPGTSETRGEQLAGPRAAPSAPG
jgi:hypothetical protein